MQIWSGFYAVTGEAAAALLGLLFVVVSINAGAVLNEADGNAKRLAQQAFQNYLTVLLVSLLAIFPSLSAVQLGYVTLSVTAIWAILVLVRLYQALTQPYEPAARLLSLRRQFSSLIGFAMLIFAALRMTFRLGDSRSLFAVAVIILLLSATTTSWNLLLRIAKAGQTAPP